MGTKRMAGEGEGDDWMSVLSALVLCARGWEPDVRLVGNLRAGAIAAACEAALQIHAAPAREGEEPTAEEWGDLMGACQHMHDHAARAYRISGDERDDGRAEKWAELAGKCEGRANALLRAAPVPARKREERDAVVAVYEKTGEVVSITFPEWWGPKRPDPDEFARRYPNTVGRRARLVIEPAARFRGEEGASHDHD